MLLFLFLWAISAHIITDDDLVINVCWYSLLHVSSLYFTVFSDSVVRQSHDSHFQCKWHQICVCQWHLRPKLSVHTWLPFGRSKEIGLWLTGVVIGQDRCWQVTTSTYILVSLDEFWVRIFVPSATLGHSMNDTQMSNVSHENADLRVLFLRVYILFTPEVTIHWAGKSLNY